MSEWRGAAPTDAVALTDLERDANLVALAHACAAGVRRLWCLADNHRARGLYDHLGWRPTGLTRTAEWSPYPIEIEYVRIGP